MQIVVLWAVQKGYLDELPVEQVKEYQNQLAEFLTTRKTELLAKIAKEKALSDALSSELKTVAEEFKQTWQSAHPQTDKAKTEKAASQQAPTQNAAK